MTEPLHVLVPGWDPARTSFWDAHRFDVVVDALADRGVVLRPWTDIRLDIPSRFADRPADAIREGRVGVDRETLDWADVVLVRRAALAVAACDECLCVATDPVALEAHALDRLHARLRGLDMRAHAFVEAVLANPTLLRNRALVVERDDQARLLDSSGSVSATALATADLVTASTRAALGSRPGAAGAWRRQIPNTVDPACYARTPPAPGVDPSVLFIGAPIEALEDDRIGPALDALGIRFAAARLAVVEGDGAESTADAEPAARADRTARPPGGRAGLSADAQWSERAAWTSQIAAAGCALAAVPGGPDSAARAEIRWLHASLVGAATVATAGGSIRDGRDGLIAPTGDTWIRALATLATDGDRRADLVGRARERIERDFAALDRADEWADAFAWAAARPGIGRTRAAQTGAAAERPDRDAAPSRGGASSPAAVPTHSGVAGRDGARRRGTSANPALGIAAAPASDDSALARPLEHRREMRRRALEEVATLARLRAGRDVCWPEGTGDAPLVSIVMPTYSRGRILVERSIASALAQTYTNIEVVVVGDHATPETLEAIRTVDDPRVRFEDLPERSPYHANAFCRWLQVGSRPYNRATALARGDWIAPTADDDVLTPDHVERLLGFALDRRLEFVYGDSWMEGPDGTWRRLGLWPPREGGFCAGAVLYAAPLRFIGMDEDCWLDLEPNDWSMWRRMIQAGARTGHLPEIVFRHHVEGREWRGIA